jgi:hypothetical protein
MEKLKSSSLLYNWIVSLQPECIFNEISKNEAEVDDCVVYFILSLWMDMFIVNTSE